MPKPSFPAAAEGMPAIKCSAADPGEAGIFKCVSDMEEPLAVARDILLGLTMIAETLETDGGAVVARLAWLALDECEAAETLRGEAFKLAHPRREPIEREGRRA